MTVRETALALLTEHEASGKYSNLALRSHIADALSGKDRALLAALFYTTVEHRLTYDYYIAALAGRPVKELKPTTRNILRLGLCQLADMDAVPEYAAVNETVKLARGRGESAFVNGILRAYLRAREEGRIPMPDKAKNYTRYLSVKYSFSQDIVKALSACLEAPELEGLLEHFNSSKVTDITVNTLKIKTNVYINTLKGLGIDAEPAPLCDGGIRINSSVDPRTLPGYNEGLFFVQDSACLAACRVLAPASGDILVDACSAPGGKSFAAAILSGDKAEIHAYDLHESKISLIADGAKRLGLESVSSLARDALTPNAELLGCADKVICDVPCSGLGVLGKKSDMRYKSTEGFSELPELQYKILKESSRYLKLGGRLLYSTCTLRREENSDVVLRFIKENPDFVLREFDIGELKASSGMLTLMPHIHGTDGFFISLIERIK